VQFVQTRSRLQPDSALRSLASSHRIARLRAISLLHPKSGDIFFQFYLLGRSLNSTVSMATFEAVVEKQHELFGRIARALENTKKLGIENLNRYTLDSRILAVDNYWNKFQVNHDKLALSATAEQRKLSYFEDDVYGTCEEAYFDSKSNIQLLRDEIVKDASADPNVSNISSSRSAPRTLPKITLPKFSGDYHDWTPFRDLFTSLIVSNNDISAVEKLHYLKGQVTGEAARFLANIAVTADNFPRAWDALTSRYNNKRVLVATHLDRLYELKPLTQKSAPDLKLLLAKVKEAIGALETLGAPVRSWDIILVHFVSRRLDAATAEAWELEQGSNKELSTFAELDAFMENRIRALEAAASVTGKQFISKKGTSKVKPSAQSHAAIVGSASCSFCSSAHYISSCPDFAAKTAEERYSFVAQKNLCYNCLGAHRLNECRTAKRCRRCNGKHHTLIHRGSTTATSSSSAMTPEPNLSSGQSILSSTSSGSAAGTHHAASVNTVASDRPYVLLATAAVTIRDRTGSEVKARALLDQGSELSFIHESLAQLLRLPRRKASVPISGIDSRVIGTTRGIVQLTIFSRVYSSQAISVSAYVMPQLTGSIPAKSIPDVSWPHIKGLSLADPSFAKPGRIDILLGANVYGSLLLGDIKRASGDGPIAQNTALGWIVSGPITTGMMSTNPPAARALRCAAADLELQESLQRFWIQEEILSPSATQRTPDERECEAHFMRTFSRDASGRYMVRLPFRTARSVLGESRTSAALMLSRVNNRIQRDEQFGTLYSDFMNEYETLSHMEAVSSSHGEDHPVYLPHHGVVREHSTTTKLRVVFNGSMKTSSGLSLNDCLHPGPKLQQDLDAVILRWRFYAVAFAADIQKMYRQIIVHPDDRDCQRILWGPSDSPAEFQLCTVTYGLASAPFLALRVIDQLAADEEARFPDAATVLRQHMYVDDVLSGADTVQLAKQKATRIDQLLRAGGFTLQKWAANAADAISDLAAPLDSAPTRELDTQAVSRTLGLLWHHETDAFSFQVRTNSPPSVWTKRAILSRVAQLYDPLGWIAPVTITGKILIQQLWQAGVEWDDPVFDFATIDAVQQQSR